MTSSDLPVPALSPGALPALEELYRELHRHPEIGFEVPRTAALIVHSLASLGVDAVAGVGGSGVVGRLTNGEGPTVMLRADMDGVPVEEKTGLPYASTDRTVDASGRTVPLMHACGHDMHMVCLLGAVRSLAENRSSWSGTLVAVFQPAQEQGGGARAMVDDGLFTRFGRPDVILAQHVTALPAGTVAVHPGPAFAAVDSMLVRLHGRGSHSALPNTAVDPVVMAAATVMRLQTVVSRVLPPDSGASLTVGELHAGTKANVIPDHAELTLNLRTFDPAVQQKALAAVRRIIESESLASDAPQRPEFVRVDQFPITVNDTAATARVVEAFRQELGAERVVDPGQHTGGEDVGILSTSSWAPLCYWFLGGTPSAEYAMAASRGTLDHDIPLNHSPFYAPVIEPTLSMGIATLTTAARAWLG